MTAIWNGLYLAGRIGCNKVIIESDCSFVVEAVQQPAETYVGSDVTMVLECKQLGLDFASVSYTQCSREAKVDMGQGTTLFQMKFGRVPHDSTGGISETIPEATGVWEGANKPDVCDVVHGRSRLMLLPNT
jgi:hypothetical protein